jgi:hypothetical protein
MGAFRDELNIWLSDNPPGSITKPPITRFASFYDAAYLLRRADQEGDDGVASSCVRAILHPIRLCAPSQPSELHDAEPGDLTPGADIIQHLTGGDPDWAPEFSATLDVRWPDHPDVRVIVQGLGEHGQATYFGQWQTRKGSTDSWKPATPMRWTLGRMWFPSDYSTRASMSKQLEADAQTLPATSWGADP